MSRTTDEHTQFVGPWYIYLDWEDRVDWRTKGSTAGADRVDWCTKGRTASVDYTSSHERQYCMFRQEVL